MSVLKASENRQFKQTKTTNPTGKTIAVTRSGYITWYLTFLGKVNQLLVDSMSKPAEGSISDTVSTTCLDI